MDNERAIKFFQEYIQCKSVHPNPDYNSALNLIEKYAKLFNLSCNRYEFAKDKPMLIITVKGEDDTLASVMLNSHTDVVPVDVNNWKVDAFSGFKDENGNIFGRGTQDMKCVGVQYLEAIHRLQVKKTKFLRTIYLTYVADEEIGGEGMKYFIKTEEFKRMNVGLVLDEGLANPTEAFTVFYGERVPWWINVTARGPAGHGSRFIENTAMEKLIRVINKCLEFREEQKRELDKGHECGKTLGDVITLNLTRLNGGVQHNVIPTEVVAGFDIRIPPTVDLKAFVKKIDAWTSEEGVSYEFVYDTFSLANPYTSLTNDNIWWSRFKESCAKLNMKLNTEIFPAATDSRFIRILGIPAFGFSPINNTPILLHDHNEFLNDKIFLRGIEIYETIITDLANTPPNLHHTSTQK